MRENHLMPEVLNSSNQVLLQQKQQTKICAERKKKSKKSNIEEKVCKILFNIFLYHQFNIAQCV